MVRSLAALTTQDDVVLALQSVAIIYFIGGVAAFGLTMRVHRA